MNLIKRDWSLEAFFFDAWQEWVFAISSFDWLDSFAIWQPAITVLRKQWRAIVVGRRWIVLIFMKDPVIHWRWTFTVSIWFLRRFADALFIRSFNGIWPDKDLFPFVKLQFQRWALSWLRVSSKRDYLLEENLGKLTWFKEFLFILLSSNWNQRDYFCFLGKRNVVQDSFLCFHTH